MSVGWYHLGSLRNSCDSEFEGSFAKMYVSLRYFGLWIIDIDLFDTIILFC